MTVIDTTRDPEALTLTLVAEFDAKVERVWKVWADPRLLERWWGPPTWPATFDTHEFSVGGQSRYFMTGPDGGKSHGWWEVTGIDEPRRLEFVEGFASPAGEPLDRDEATRIEVTLEPTGTGTRMTTVNRFANADQMERLLKMGMEEGMAGAMGQIDALL
jgi:uncharacterized protein YndB with AHSA1/START domain